MTNLFKKAAFAAVVTGFAFAGQASAATSSTQAQATGQATVKIYTPLILKAVTGSDTMDFGILVGPASVRGTAASFPMGGTTASPVVTCATGWSCSGTVKAAQFTVSGTPGAFVHVDVPTGPVNLTGSVSGTVNVTNFVTDLAAPTATQLGTTATAFGVAGTLNVPAGTADGVYTGSFNVYADYN
ncbi:DUF4402 domain-containing protein [Sphingomonas sp. ASV193]|uniref:DUF4402 domain-containing protein n=1 Tax=Sphingomonas sp. ASV193 TaxID=3144405 RepID=UPI0032E92B12